MSKRKYSHIKVLEPQIIAARNARMTRQEIADKLGMFIGTPGTCPGPGT